jgi:hypothetical protein
MDFSYEAPAEIAPAATAANGNVKPAVITFPVDDMT